MVSTLRKYLPVPRTFRKKKVGIKEALQRLQNLEKQAIPRMETFYLFHICSMVFFLMPFIVTGYIDFRDQGTFYSLTFVSICLTVSDVAFVLNFNV